MGSIQSSFTRIVTAGKVLRLTYMQWIWGSLGGLSTSGFDLHQVNALLILHYLPCGKRVALIIHISESGIEVSLANNLLQ